MEILNTKQEILNMPIEELGLSTRTYNILHRAGIDTVGMLLSYSINNILNIRNFGSKALEEVENKLIALKIFNRHLDSSDWNTAMIEFLSGEENEELEAMSSLIKQKEQEAIMLEIMVNRTKKNRDILLDLKQKKQAALKELQALSKEQERLKAENEALDEQIAQVAAALGLSNIDTNNSEMNNNGKQI